MSKQSQAFY